MGENEVPTVVIKDNLMEQQPLPKPFKIDDLPQDIQDFINKHGGIGLLVEKCMELNPQWVDSAMAWVFIIQWAREELAKPTTVC